MTRSFEPWEVRHVDLSAGWVGDDWKRPEGEVGLFMVFWMENLALGHLLYPPGTMPEDHTALRQHVASCVAPAVGHRLFGPRFRGPFPARRVMQPTVPDLPNPAALLECGKPLQALADLWRARRRVGDAAGSGPGAPASISVVICTRNRPDLLRRCLTSLALQERAPLETLVVDNDPDSGITRPVVDAFTGAEYVAEATPGLSPARNAGVLNARGDVIAFTDDDVRVHRGWVAALTRIFEEDALAATTGLILPDALDTPAQLAFQLNGEGWGFRPLTFDSAFFDATNRIGVPVWRIGAGANMAFRRRVFCDVGLFDERLGAGRSGCSEDSELWYRLLVAGESIRYDPSAVVFHTHRERSGELRDQMYAYMKGHVTALMIQQSAHGGGNLYRLFLELPFYYGRKVLGRMVKGRRPTTLPLAPQIRGWFAGLLYYMKHRNEKPWSSTDYPAASAS